MDKTQLDMVADAADAPLHVVQAVLWHLGDENLGVQPGSFITALLQAADRADSGNRLRLSLGFPEYMAVLRTARDVSIEVLRDVVKARVFS